MAFGMTSGVITTTGLMVGLHAGTHSRVAVIGGILTIAIADAFSDALGIHISEESDRSHTTRQVWASTLSAFASKLLLALTFLVPVLLLDLSTAMLVSAAWCLAVLTGMSFVIARSQGEGPLRVIAEHLAIAVIVIIATHFAGRLIASLPA